MLELLVIGGIAGLVYKFGVPFLGIAPHFGKPSGAPTGKLKASKYYALDVLANPNADGDAVHNAIIAANGGHMFMGVGWIPQAVTQGLTVGELPALVPPGASISLTPFGNGANRWKVFVQATADIALPLQPAPTLIILSGASIDPSKPDPRLATA